MTDFKMYQPSCKADVCLIQQRSTTGGLHVHDMWHHTFVIESHTFKLLSIIRLIVSVKHTAAMLRI